MRRANHNDLEAVDGHDRHRFSTLRLRAFLDANYVNGSTCIGGGVAIGPYVSDGSASGLSSFKSC